MPIDLPVWTIYLDTCCLSRLFDKQTQLRVRQETIAINRILGQLRVGYWHWISSDVLAQEVDQNPNLRQRFQTKDLLIDVNQTVYVGAREILRAKRLEALGFKELDALHIACAESGDVDIFLTTDDRLLGRAKRKRLNLYVQVENPYMWLQGIDENERIGTDR